MKKRATRNNKKTLFARSATKLYEGVRGLQECGMTLEQIVVVLKSTIRTRGGKK